jgi:hypothetical protein
MYKDSEKVYTRKSSHAGIISKTRNYIMYEYVDKSEKFREKKPKPILEESRPERPEPLDNPLDNYRYYEDLTLRDKRKRSLVKHQRTSEPVGRETPFDRDSFKKTIINNASYSNSLRNYSNESSNKKKAPKPIIRQAPKPVLKQSPKPVLKQAPKPALKQTPKPALKQAPKPVLKQAPRPELKQGSRPEIKQGPRPEFIPGTRKGSNQDIRQGPSLTPALGSNKGSSTQLGLGPRQESEPYLKQKYRNSNYIAFFPYQSQLNKCPTCGRDYKHEGSNRENHTVLRQLYVGPQRTYNFRANKTQIEERKTNYYDCYESDGSEDESDFNYKYRQINCVKYPDIRDSKTFHRRRKKGGASSYENIYRKEPRFDGGFSSLTSSSSYSKVNGHK